MSALEVAAAADESVSQQEKLIDIQQKNDLSVLVAYDHEIIMLLKCIVVLSLFSDSWDCLRCSQA